MTTPLLILSLTPPPMVRPVVLWSLSLLLVGAAVGCAVPGAKIKAGGCQSDSDCDGKMRCFDERVCIQTSLHDWDVVMRVSPGPNSGLVEEHFNIKIGGVMPPARTWQLTRPARVRGTVRLAAQGAGLSELIPGTLIASAPEANAAMHLRYTAKTLLTPQQDSNERNGDATGGATPAAETPKWSFELRVQPGRTYDIAFWPQSDELPPHYTRRTIGGDVDNLAIVLPTTPDIITVTGRVLSQPVPLGCDPVSGPAAVTECVAECKPVPTLQVVLLDTERRQRSTIGKTDSEGRFSVKADASAGPLSLRFEPAVNSKNSGKVVTDAEQLSLSLPAGTLTLPIDTEALRKAKVVNHALGDINIGPLPAHHLLVREILGDDGLALPGAQVHVRREIASPKRCEADGKGGWQEVDGIADFNVTRSDTSDSSGRIEVHTLAGKGEIKVIPAAHESAAVWVVNDVELSPTDKPIRCTSRRKVKGHVEYRDKPIIGATIQIQPLPPESDALPPADPALVPIFINSNDDGRYSVFLDAGRYAMIIRPPPNSGLARTVSSILKVTAPSPADGATIEHDLAAWPPTVLHGLLLGRTGKPEAGVLIDVLGKQMQLLESLTAEGAAVSTQRSLVLLQTHRLGSAVTGSDGRFEILVAPGNLAE